jgi:hypothetical protein
VSCLSGVQLTHDHAGLRVKWLKQHARAQRWREEMILVEEEMHQSLAFCLWRAKWWTGRISNHTGKPAHVIEGLVAYAMEQRNTEEQWAIVWAVKWAAIRERATVVLQGHLSNTITGSLPDLLVELKDEDEREDEGDGEDA